MPITLFFLNFEQAYFVNLLDRHTATITLFWGGFVTPIQKDMVQTKYPPPFQKNKNMGKIPPPSRLRTKPLASRVQMIIIYNVGLIVKKKFFNIFFPIFFLIGKVSLKVAAEKRNNNGFNFFSIIFNLLRRAY